MRVRPQQTPTERRRHLRRAFDAQVTREWARYQGRPWRVLHRTLRERFLERHLRGLRGTVVELGSGPGRFTPVIRDGAARRVVAVDLSYGSLLAGRRRGRAGTELAPIDWVRGAGERLPFASGSVDAVVAVGNIVGFAAGDAPRLLDEIARVTRQNGILIADFATAVGAVQEFVKAGSEGRFLTQILRKRRYYLIDRVLSTRRQPLAPERLCRWEFRFYTPSEATVELTSAGFLTVDTMGVAPAAGLDDRIVSAARRQKGAWRSLLELEELAGRCEGVPPTAGGFLVSARRSRRPIGRSPRPTPRRRGAG